MRDPRPALRLGTALALAISACTSGTELARPPVAPTADAIVADALGDLAPTTALASVHASQTVATGAFLGRLCAIRDDDGGAVWCWGEQHGRPLAGCEAGAGLVRIAGTEGSVEIVGFGQSVCARNAAGRVLCWAIEEGADLMDRPVVIDGLPPVDAIAGRGVDFCARESSGDVWCWSDAGMGPPTPVRTASHAADLTTDCAISRDGELSCWRAPACGIEPSGLALGLVAGTIADPLLACAMTRSSDVDCWGYCAPRDPAMWPRPVRFGRAPSGSRLTFAPGTVCAISPAGELQCWPIPEWSPRGVPAPAPREPETVLLNVASIASSSRRTVYRDRQGVVRWFGSEPCSTRVIASPGVQPW